MPAPSMTTADAAGFVGGDTVKEVFNRQAFFAYRANSIFRQLSEVKWSVNDPPMPGNQVAFTLLDAIAPAVTPLGEAVEPAPQNMTDTQVAITLEEFGNAIKNTKKLRITSFYNLDVNVPREVAAHMEESCDLIARAATLLGTVKLFGGGAANEAALVAGNVIAANNLRRARAILAGKNTPPPAGSPFYAAVGHPDVGYDLRVETGQAAWSAPHVYADPQALYTGEVGALDGVRWIENANAKIDADAGAGNVDGYVTLVVGEQYLGEAVGEPQHMVISGPFDDLQRFLSVGWYALLGYGVVRDDSGVQIITSSSIGANV